MQPIQTEFDGFVEVQCLPVRDRGIGDASPIRCTSAVLLTYLRRVRSVEELLHWLYLKGVSTGYFEGALTVLLGWVYCDRHFVCSCGLVDFLQSEIVIGDRVLGF